MSRISKPMLSIVSVVTGGILMAAALQFSSLGREPSPAPTLNVKDTPINREARGVTTSYAPVIKRVAPSVVNIYSTRTMREHPSEMPMFDDPFFRRFFGPDGESRGQKPRSQKAQGLGSGVIVSEEGYILTANHVVEGAEEVKVALASGGREFTAKVIGTDPPTDIAVLKVEAKDLPAITIADSDKLEVGDVVLAVGNPFGVGQTVTMGIVSGVGRTSLGIAEYENFIQTDAAINPGNSGGALVDAEGRLIGINTAIYSRSGGYQGVGFAVPVNMARTVMERLINDGKVTRGWLGISLQPEITEDLAKEFDLPDQSGAMVGGIIPNTPASKAGLKSGDVIREVDGRKVSDDRQFRLMISQTAPGTRVNLKIVREGKEQSIAVRLGELPADRASLGRAPLREGETTPQDALEGVEVTDIDANARRQFNIPGEVRGALITNIDSDSTAANANPPLRPGDVIVEINHKPVTSADDAVELSEVKGNRVLLRVWRDGASFFVVVDNSKKK